MKPSEETNQTVFAPEDEVGVGTISLSIIIVSWNTQDLLAKCLASVFDEAKTQMSSPELPLGSNQDLEVFVVDNASQDGSARMVKDHFPRVQLIENPVNVGFAGANNQGIQASTGRFVLLLNSDTEVHSGALQALVQFMDAHPEAGAAGARLLNSDYTPQLSVYPEPSLIREFWRLMHFEAAWRYADYPTNAWHPDEPREVDVVQGACVILRRTALNRSGRLDEEYFMYSEEFDLCRRIRQLGWRIYWVPRAIVVHHGGQSTRQIAAAMFMRLYSSKIRYFRKHRGPAVARGYKLILLLAALLRILVTPLALLEPTNTRRRHFTLAGHYRQLISALPGL